METKKRVLLVMVILLLAAVSCLFYRQFWVERPAAIQASGTIEATGINLIAKTSGTIKTLSIKDGDPVKAGQVVAELDRSDLAAQRERDAMTLLKAEAQLKDLTSGARAQEKAEAVANVEMARVSCAKAAEDLARMQALFAEGAVAGEELKKAEVNAALEEYRLQAAEARLGLLEAGSRPEVIEAARAEVERSRAVLKATEAMIRDLQVVAPRDGVVTNKNYEAGEFVQMGATIATIVDLDDMWVKVYIPTDDLPAIKLGQDVQISVSGHSGVFRGKVAEIASKGEFTPKTIQTKKERTNVVFGVKIVIEDSAGVLKPGMPADVTF